MGSNRMGAADLRTISGGTTLIPSFLRLSSLAMSRPGCSLTQIKDSVYVDGNLVGSVADVAANTGPVYAPLKAALMAQNERMLGGAGQTDISKREVTIMLDKGTPYSLLKKIMLTCSDAEYGKVSFAVIERERAAT